MKRTKSNAARAALKRARSGRIILGRPLLLAASFACLLLLGLALLPARGTGANVRVESGAGQSAAAAAGGDLWAEVEIEEAAKSARRQSLPLASRALRLNRARLSGLLRRAPVEFSEAARTSAPIVALPLPDGSFVRLRVAESPVMEPSLAARFPEIKTYRGQGVDDPATTARFDSTPAGLHAVVLSGRGTFYVEPDARGDDTLHLAYAHADLTDEAGALACAVSEAEQAAHAAKPGGASARPLVASGATLRTYRLAVAATAEYTQTYGGGTVAGALSAIATTVNLVNAIYERDAAVRLVLIDNETSIIFTDTSTDGYTSDNVGALINENPNRLNSIIGAPGYDIGHVFDGRLHGGGSFSFRGQAGIGVVCNTSKARGVTIFRSVQPSNVIAYYIAAHELGHQFGATHTFNANVGDCGIQRASATAYEPGTGSTIMGYRLNCGSEDLRSSDTYFHIASLDQIINFTTNGGGSSCPAQTATGNSPPAVSAGPAYTIPAQTPFTLTATGGDPDGDALTYTWEQFDLGPAAPPDTDDGARPIFRSFAPHPSPARTFPSLSDILFNTQTFGESLPTTTRTLNFRVTARDNRAGGGGSDSSATQINVRSESGPFRVNAPAAGASWTGETAQTILWDVANTTGAPVGCASVRILLSTDGGKSFPHVLAAETPNDGSESVFVPNVATLAARVKVEAVGNIFFDISDENFTVTQAANAAGTVQFNLSAYSAGEGAGRASITVTRTGDAAGAAAVEYATVDDPAAVRCDAPNGTAYARCDYSTTVDALAFGPGEREKTFTVPLVDDAHVEGPESVRLRLGNASGAALGAQSTATLLINDNDAAAGAPNPVSQSPFFVGLQYLDFLSREPEPSGFQSWLAVLNNCPDVNNNPACDRVTVSSSFFRSEEFQLKGYYVFLFYKVAFKRLPAYAEVIPDMRSVTGQTSAEVYQKRAAFAEGFARRAEFEAAHPPQSSGAAYVAALLAPYNTSSIRTIDPANPDTAEEVTLTQDQLAARLNAATLTRAQVLRAVVQSREVDAREYNGAFVAMQYYGYLRRTPEEPGYTSWLNYLNSNPTDFRTMVGGFMNSVEYRLRFGQP